MSEDQTAVMPAAADEPCAGCGSPLASDQRYCLNCGRRRGEARVDYAPLLAGSEPEEQRPRDPAETPVPPVAAAPPAPREASPFVAVAGIALLGLMLLVGVLIGRGGDGTETAATPTVLQVGEGQGAEVAEAGTGGASTSTETGGDSKAAETEKTGNADGGNSAETVNDPSLENPEVASREQLEDLANSSGEEYQEASENLPDTIAIPGEPPPTDNEEPGGGTEAQVIK